ncbi:hypothetical protein C8Q72DRAFT_138727 [Fomitopsis betulina]|nr:hypothetical protein C8Q72DRAFT_138727 [Fomitopsis betulina]
MPRRRLGTCAQHGSTIIVRSRQQRGTTMFSQIYQQYWSPCCQSPNSLVFLPRWSCLCLSRGIGSHPHPLWHRRPPLSSLPAFQPLNPRPALSRRLTCIFIITSCTCSRIQFPLALPGIAGLSLSQHWSLFPSPSVSPPRFCCLRLCCLCCRCHLWSPPLISVLILGLCCHYLCLCSVHLIIPRFPWNASFLCLHELSPFISITLWLLRCNPLTCLCPSHFSSNFVYH